MPVHVDQLSTEVVAEAEAPAAAAGGGGEAMRWEQLARWRQLQSNAVRDQLRTSAEGFDD